MFPIFVIAIGIAVLAFGKRLAVLGAAVGALFGLALAAPLFPGQTAVPCLRFSFPILLAVIGFFVAGFAKGIVNIVVTRSGSIGRSVRS